MVVSQWFKRSGVLLLALTAILWGLAACAPPPAPVPPTTAPSESEPSETEPDTEAETESEPTETEETDTAVDESAEAGNVKTVYVGPEQVDCTGVAPQKCYLVKENPADEYSFYYDEIEGFNFEPGYEYELRVEEIEVEDPPADASSIRWVLVEEVSKTPVDDTAVVEETDTETEEAEETATSDTEPTEPTVADTATKEEPGLQLTNWILGAFKGEPVDDLRVTIKFTSDQFSGEGGCNTYFGSYTVSGNELSIGENIGSTMMACPGPQMQFESSYLATLPQVASYQIEGGLLTLSDAEGNVLLTYYEDVPAALEGTPWTVAAFNNGRDAVTSVLVGTEITAVFGDGQVAGNASCNSYNGTYTVDGDAITIGPLATTRMMCPEEIMQQETEFLAAMQNAATYTIEGNRLTLYGAEEERLVDFIGDTNPIEGEATQLPALSLSDVSVNSANLGEQLSGEIVPRMPYDASMPPSPVGHPAHLLFSVGDVPVMRVYPIQQYMAMWETEGDMTVTNMVDRLEEVVADKPLDLENNVPILPPAVGYPDIVAQVRYFDFGNDQGSGVRYLARFAQEANPLTNDQLFYYYQGLSNDGQYYVSVSVPLSTAALPDSVEELTAEELEAIFADFDAYRADTTAVLNNLANDDFDPNLALLDEAIESLDLTGEGDVDYGEAIGSAVEGLSGDEVQLDVAGFANSYEWQIVGPFQPDPETPPYLNGLPRHALLGFDGETVNPQIFMPLERQIRLIPLEPYKAMYSGERRADLDNRIAALETILAEQPETADIPVLPDVGAVPAFQSNINYVDFSEGSGVRYLTAFKQDVSPVTQGELVYMYIGVSADGHFLVTFSAPVNTAVLPASGDMSAEEMDELAQNYDEYISGVVSDLSTAEDFDPALETLDGVISSLTIAP